ncbi:signal transduction histidine kinase [Nocardiopsis sp. Huas11]|uniref:sensor histidine kinase n=1 Tax=Nocardiopsis sp. Huas11 TaxID=2183912 RepID=UPI000F1A50D4|nr:sensor histidine kinase [Nocardiopsis sp. Huas11]RKS10553.1 signal transduction histidine kinase [Nocardiopsis sp. Huas11]
MSGVDERHAWDLGVWWDVYFTAVMGAVAVLAALSTDPGRRVVAVALVGAAVAAYYLYGRRLLLTEHSRADRRSLVFMGLLLATVLPAVMLNPTLTFMVVAVSPLCFMTAGTVRAVPTVALILIVPVLVRGLTEGQEWETFTVSLLVHAVIIAFSGWFGFWFERIVEQSYERAELIRQLRESREEAVRLSEEAGAMAEREHLGRELHDTLAQGLTSVIALTQAVESEMDTDPALARRHLALMRETASDNLADARAMVAARQAVRPGGGGSLDAALARATERLAAELGIGVDLTVRGTPVPLPGDVQVCLLRTAQEALANIRRHSGAEHADVVLEYSPTTADLTVSDDGRGFTPGAGPGHGLGNMRHRARGAGGVLTVDSVPGAGTTVRASIPLRPEAAQPAPEESAR